MKARTHDPLRLDVERYASEAGRLEGQWALRNMHRLSEACNADAPPGPADGVAWQADGERRGSSAGPTQVWLRLRLATHLNLTCQRCLKPVETPLAVDRWFQFVPGEAQAAALDADSESDVLASTRALDLHELAEDELLLALPIVPRHEACPQPLLPAQTQSHEAEAANPFAALALLKGRRH